MSSELELWKTKQDISVNKFVKNIKQATGIITITDTDYGLSGLNVILGIANQSFISVETREGVGQFATDPDYTVTATNLASAINTDLSGIVSATNPDAIEITSCTWGFDGNSIGLSVISGEATEITVDSSTLYNGYSGDIGTFSDIYSYGTKLFYCTKTGNDGWGYTVLNLGTP